MGLLGKLFGGGKKHGVGPGTGPGGKGTRTVDDSTPADSGPRVKPMDSKEFAAEPVAARKTPQDEDTGPYPIGKTVGEIYQIRRVLGWGGMGIVYGAFDTATNREVAVKVPLGKVENGVEIRRFVDDPDARERFAREAEIWGGLVYPHIVHAFDMHDDQTTDYRPAVFMDYCDGGSLADRLRKGPVPMPDALDIAIQVCWAMEFAHNFDFGDGRKGLIHRDLKPGNVLLMKDGKALVSDFGLVKSLDLEEMEVTQEQLKKQDAAVEASLTHGLAMGTPAYMPPEQWRGRACPQSDIYALGVVLYELFCGSLPFTAKDWEGFCAAHCKVLAPDPRRLNGQVPAALAELMLACLAKEPCARPQNFGEVANRLEAAYRQRTGETHDTRRPKPASVEVSQAAKKARACALIRLGIGRELRGEWSEAERHFRQSLSIFDELGDQAGMGRCYTNMGLVADERGNYDEAMELYRKDLAICKRLGDQAGMGACYTNMGVVADERANYDEAMELYRKSLAIKERLGDQAGMGSCYTNMGLVAKERGNYDEAMELYRKDLNSLA